MVDKHAVGNREVDAAIQNVSRASERDVLRHRQRTRQTLEVADRARFDSECKRRHEVVELPVVVIRREQDHELRIECLDARPRRCLRPLHLGHDLRSRIVVTVQRRMRKALKLRWHVLLPSEPQAP